MREVTIMSTHPFRFGVVATPQDPKQWAFTARRVAELGYSTLLMPDGLHQVSPVAALATAAATAAEVRVGTWVLAAPLRPPAYAAWEAHSMTVLTGGRFELGIGTGLPRAVTARTEELGMPAQTPGERLAAVGETIDRLRELDDATHTPVLVAAGGPRARALAAEKADIVTLATSPLTPRAEVAALSAELRDLAEGRADEIEIAMNLFAVGDEIAPWARQALGADTGTLLAHDSLVLLRGSTREMADELNRRRDSVRASYICVSAAFMEQLAPVVEVLAGR